MKKLIIYFVAWLPLISCVRQNAGEELSRNWNGYDKYLKTGEIIHTLWAGQHTNVGTVTYGIDNDANFYVTYDCSASGWLISETHMFAGDKAVMPLNKPGAPKTGLFPHSGNHSPRVCTFTYRIPLSQLPPCASPGFVVASHCVVHSPSGLTETAWAEGSYTFSDKGWGWYDAYYYDPLQEQLPVLYGTACNNDSLRLYHIDLTSGDAELILVEYVGSSSGFYDGAAYDNETGIFYFVKYNTGELWYNQLLGEEPSYCAGTLAGTASSGTFYDQDYYYIDNVMNTINKVSFTVNLAIEFESVLDTLPKIVMVNDIAMSPDGDLLYMLGLYNDGSTELITWDVEERNFYSTSIAVNEGTQIAFGSDNKLYALSPAEDCTECTFVYSIDIEDGELLPLDDEVIIIEDPFSDLAGGPGQ